MTLGFTPTLDNGLSVIDGNVLDSAVTSVVVGVVTVAITVVVGTLVARTRSRASGPVASAALRDLLSS